MAFPRVSLDKLFASRRAGLVLLGAVLGLGAIARVWLAFVDDGIYWPDEIYQSLEPAHRLVFGYGLISWEYALGGRSWTLPFLVAVILKACSVAGLTDPREYLSVVRVAMCAVGVATAYSGYLLARRLGAREWFAASGAAFFALAGPAVYFGPRALSETASALPIVLGFACVLGDGSTRRSRIAGASLLGLATLLRLHNGVFCVALLLLWAGRRRWRELAEAVLVLGVWAFVFGALDKLTWGGWFQSAEVYLRFSLAGGGPITGNQPASYYASMFFRSMPMVTIAVAVLALVGAPRARGLAFVTALFLLAHVLAPNKAYRYVLVALPLAGALAAVGLEWLWARRFPRLTAALVAILAVSAGWSLATSRGLTFGDIGPYEQSRPTESAYDDKGPINRLLMQASRQADLCGLRIEVEPLVWIGGYSYFHRNVPMYGADGPPRQSGFYNYVIVRLGDNVGNPVGLDGDFMLRRLSNASCRPDPDYDWHLPGYEGIRQDLWRLGFRGGF